MRISTTRLRVFVADRDSDCRGGARHRHFDAMDILESSDDEADAAAAPAPTPTVAPPPTVPVVDAVEVEELPDVPEQRPSTTPTAPPADSATASSSPTGSAAAGSSSAHAAEPAAGDEWRTEGHALLQTRVAKYYGARRTPYTGTIVGWDPLGFEGVAPLFHVVHDDGDEEDLEEHEVEPAAQLYKREAAREAAKERKLSKAAAPPPKGGGRASLTPEERQRREEEQAARAAERKQERDAARAEKARLAAEAKRDFGNHPMPFLKPVKELDAATANDAEAVAVWEAARRVIAAKVEALEHVHGWQVAYHLRGVQTCGVGDLIVIPPEEMEKLRGAQAAARRRRRRRRVGRRRRAAAHRQQWRQRHPQHRRALPVALPPRARAAAGTAVWAPPAKGELVEFEGKVKEDDPLSWLQARVVRSGCGLGGRFQVAVTTDANFRETFSYEDEGTEWRRLAADAAVEAAPPPKPLALPAPKLAAALAPKPKPKAAGKTAAPPRRRASACTSAIGRTARPATGASASKEGKFQARRSEGVATPTSASTTRRSRQRWRTRATWARRKRWRGRRRRASACTSTHCYRLRRRLFAKRQVRARGEWNGGHTNLGSFDTAVEAAVAYARHMAKKEQGGKGAPTRAPKEAGRRSRRPPRALRRRRARRCATELRRGGDVRYEVRGSSAEDDSSADEGERQPRKRRRGAKAARGRRRARRHPQRRRRPRRLRPHPRRRRGARAHGARAPRALQPRRPLRHRL